jgi:hypothetical protein
MAADTIAGYIQGLLDGIEFRQTGYALELEARREALSAFLTKAAGHQQTADVQKNAILAPEISTRTGSSVEQSTAPAVTPRVIQTAVAADYEI